MNIVSLCFLKKSGTGRICYYISFISYSANLINVLFYMMPMFLINTITAWDEPPRVRHQFSYALAKKFPLVFISRNKIGWFKIRTSVPETNITLIEPYFPVDYRFRYRIPFINRLYQKWLYSKLKELYPDIWVVNFDFTATLLKGYFEKSIYYCHDEYVGNSKYRNTLVDKYIAAAEKKVAEQSVFCLATARSLTQKLNNYNSNTFQLPLASSLPPANYSNTFKPRGTDKIVVALMGVINSRHASVDAVNRILADDRFRVCLIGPVESSFMKKIKNTDRLETTGILKFEMLADKLKEIDVGAALYNLSRANPGTTSNKLWQYLSAGKPVVISELNNYESDDFPEKYVYFVKDESELDTIIARAYHEDTPELAKKRIEFAMQNSWDSRVERFLEIFRRYSGSNQE
jgi:hypothetical protein